MKRFRLTQLVVLGAGVAALAMSACSDSDQGGTPGGAGNGGAAGHAAGSAGKGGSAPVGGSGGLGHAGNPGAGAGAGGLPAGGAGGGEAAGTAGEGGAGGNFEEAGSGGEAGAAPVHPCGPGLIKPTAPAAIAVTAEAVLVAAYAAEGTQTYTCQATTVDTTTTYAWSVASVPDAKLYGDDCMQSGTHYAGPHWQANDGSIIKGTKKAAADSATANSIPQLLLSAVPDAGVAGILSPVTAVQRLNTVGGIAPVAGCDLAHVSSTVAVPYTATYYFYSGNSIPL